MKFPCRLCSLELTDQQMLKNHFTINHPENLQFQCRTCDVEFDDLSEIIAHMGTHLKTSHQCSFCLKMFSSKQYLHNHYEADHPGVDRSVCLICNKKYSDPSALAKHIMVHTGERPYYCPFCFMTFGLKCSQVVHIRRHTNYRPYKCQHCPKRFFNAGELRKHERLHTGEKPYKCTICKKSYTMRETLTNHLKRHKKFNMKCNHCSKGFNDRKLLETHMSTHSGVKPFLCPLCSETKFDIGSLRRHIISLHTDNLNTNCQICGQFEEDTFSLAQHILTHRTDFVGSKTQWFDYVNNATKSQLSLKREKYRRKSKSKKDNNKSIDTSDNNSKYVSQQQQIVEEPKLKCENVTFCDIDANGKVTVSDSQTKNQKKKRQRRKNKKFNKRTTNKNQKLKINHAADNSVSSTEEYQERFEIPLIYRSEKSNCKDSCASLNNIKKDYVNQEEKVDVKQEEEEDVEPQEDDDYEPHGGIQEVEVPEFKFKPTKKEFDCSLCDECFMSQEELLQHVGVHI